jgi:O-antigen/teichoic acid export membrane protein
VGSFFVTPIILENIGDAKYGLYSFCNSIVSWLSLISTALGASYIFYVNKEINEKGTTSRTSTLFTKMLFILATIIAIIAISLGLILKFSGFQFKNYSYEDNNLIFLLLSITGLNVAVTVFFSVFKLFNKYKKSFIFVKRTQVFLLILTYCLDLVLALTTKSVIAIAIASLISAFLGGILNLIYALFIRKMVFEKAKISNNKKEISSILKFSSIILVSIVIFNLDSNIDKTLLGLLVDSTSVTLYQLSITFALHLTMVAYSFSEIMQPNIYYLYRNEKIDEANSLFLKICKVQSLVVMLIIGGFISCGYHFVILWISKDRIEVYFYAIALLISQIIPLTKTAASEAERATNKHKIPMIIGVVSALVNVGLTTFLIIILPRQYAIWGCVVGTVAARIIFNYILNPIYDKKAIMLPMGLYYLNLLKILGFMICGIAPSLVVASLLHTANFHIAFKVIIEGLTFVSVYGLFCFIFEKKSLKNIYLVYFKRGRNHKEGEKNV